MDIFNLQHCLWNILASPSDAIEILLTPEDFGNFPNGSVQLRIGYGYKDNFPPANDETELALYDFPVAENTTETVICDVAWVEMLTLKEVEAFRVFYTIKVNAGRSLFI